MDKSKSLLLAACCPGLATLYGLKKSSIREVIRKKSNCLYLTKFKDKVFSKKGVI